LPPWHDSGAENHENAFAAGALRRTTLGELTAPQVSLARFKGRERGGTKGRGGGRGMEGFPGKGRREGRRKGKGRKGGEEGRGALDQLVSERDELADRMRRMERLPCTRAA